MKSQTDRPGLAQVFKLERTVRYLRTGRVTHDIAYGLTSLTAAAEPHRWLAIVRAYWGVKSDLHYRRDVTMQEDRLRSHSPAFGQVMASLNNLITGLTSCLGGTNLLQARRHFDAHLDHALRLLFSRLA